jgi:hypothetical protein
LAKGIQARLVAQTGEYRFCQTAMSLIIRIDVDRPYGRAPWHRHVCSRVSSDFYFPKITSLGYLQELETMLGWLNEAQARAYVFFRRCTVPSASILDMIDSGGHEVGLHLENSRSFSTFLEEKQLLEQHVGKKIPCFSKHGSGGAKYGLHHFAPYEPEKYIDWASKASMRLFLGNLEDPRLDSTSANGGSLVVFPSAFWLEPSWRDTEKFPVDWLLDRAQRQDIVLLAHPENVLADAGLTADFKRIIRTLESRIVQ